MTIFVILLDPGDTFNTGAVNVEYGTQVVLVNWIYHLKFPLASCKLQVMNCSEYLNSCHSNLPGAYFLFTKQVLCVHYNPEGYIFLVREPDTVTLLPKKISANVAFIITRTNASHESKRAALDDGDKKTHCQSKKNSHCAPYVI